MTPGFRIGLLWFQLIFGAAYFVYGLRGPLIARSAAPLGLMFFMGGLFQFLDRFFPDNTALITLYALSFTATAVWFVWVVRASHARQKELLRQRHADELKSLTQMKP